MNDRFVAETVVARLGKDTLSRLLQLRARLWWRRAVRAGLVTLAAAALGVALLQLLGRAFPIEALPWMQGAVVALGVVAWLVASARRRPSLVETARRADEELGLRQRLGTALELAAGEATDPLVARQLADARARLNETEIRHAFPPRLARRPLAIAGVGLAMTLLLVAWPNPQDDLINQRRTAREAAERVAERIEELAEELGEENVDNPDPRREELEERLRELARQLREQGDDREATLARIGSVQEELSRQTDPQAAERDAALTQLARAASRAATSDEQANPEADPEQAAADLEELAEQVASLTPEEAAARAAEMSQAAQNGAASQPQAAKALAAAADALATASRSGSEADQQAAAEALEQAAEAFRQSQRDRQAQRDISQAQSALQDGARQVARAGQPSGATSG
ncbi:MAG: hypothetical protein ACR2F5_00190, partial [Candidatus Limnocylindria bacterium]